MSDMPQFKEFNNDDHLKTVYKSAIENHSSQSSILQSVDSFVKNNPNLFHDTAIQGDVEKDQTIESLDEFTHPKKNLVENIAIKKLCLVIGNALVSGMCASGMSFADVDAACNAVRPGATRMLINRLLSGKSITLAQIAILLYAMNCNLRIELVPRDGISTDS